ncbi:MAG: FAD-dependent monooxygenase [Pseudomonadota bacterium]
MSNPKIVIAGAGIAGLTCALALAQRGHSVRVHEVFDEPEEFGAGIQVPPNAWRVLDALGLADALSLESIMFTTICLIDAHSGDIELQMPVNDDPGSITKFVAIQRAQLHMILWKAVSENPLVEIMTSCKVQGAVEHSDHVEIICETPNGQIVEKASVLIGADGIWSNVRQYVKGARQPVPTGRIALRAMVPSLFDNSEPHVTAWMGPKCHVVTYPVHTGSTHNVVAIINGAAHSGSWSQKLAGPLPEDLAVALSHLTPLDIDEVDFTRWPLYSVAPEGAWHSDRICLIGDAAHGMEPFAAQGAAMGIEDAYVLAKKLYEIGVENSQAAFESYRAARLPRIKKVAKRTEFNRFAYHQSGIGRIVRNAVFKMRKPEDFISSLDWLYDFDATR